MNNLKTILVIALFGAFTTSAPVSAKGHCVTINGNEVCAAKAEITALLTHNKGKLRGFLQKSGNSHRRSAKCRPGDTKKVNGVWRTCFSNETL